MKILYADRNLLVCQKPVGVYAEPMNGHGLPELAADELRSRGEPDEVYTVHRLDRDVGGLTILARSREAAGKLSVQIQNGEVQKEYLAVVQGSPEKPYDTLRDLLFRDATKGKTYVVDRMRKGVREAVLEYRALATDKNTGFSLLLIHLHTGRTHQIRVQFASRKLPLVGDGRYGSGDGGDTPALFAFHLRFRKPFQRNKRIDIYTLPNDIYPFSLFGDLKQLLQEETEWMN